GERFQGLDDAGVQHPSPLLEETVISHLVRQGVREGEVALGEQPRLVQELSRLQMGEAAVERRLGQLGNGLQERQGHLCANDRCCLQQLFLLRRQPVDTRREHCLYRGRHLNTWERLGQAIRPPLSDQHLCFHQGAHALLQEEGITPSACDQEECEWPQAGVSAQQCLEECIRTGRRQGVEPELAVIRLAAPAMLELRTVVDEQEESGHRQALGQAVQPRLRRRGDPVQVLTDQEQRLPLACVQEEALEPIKRALAPLWGIKRQERAVRGQDVQEGEQRWDRPVQRLVQGEELPSHLGADGTGVVALL